MAVSLVLINVNLDKACMQELYLLVHKLTLMHSKCFMLLKTYFGFTNWHFFRHILMKHQKIWFLLSCSYIYMGLIFIPWCSDTTIMLSLLFASNEKNQYINIPWWSTRRNDHFRSFLWEEVLADFLSWHTVLFLWKYESGLVMTFATCTREKGRRTVAYLQFPEFSHLFTL